MQVAFTFAVTTHPWSDLNLSPKVKDAGLILHLNQTSDIQSKQRAVI